MSKTIIPANYTPALNLYDTQRAIGTVKRLFADTLCATLNLYRVSAPLFVEASTGLNDDLNGVERKVTFDMKDGGIEAQVVQSLAKWKRKALKDYGFRVGNGSGTAGMGDRPERSAGRDDVAADRRKQNKLPAVFRGALYRAFPLCTR